MTNTFQQDVTLTPLNAAKFSENMFNIKNPTTINKTFKVTITVPNNVAKLANFGIKTNGQEYVLHFADKDVNNYLEGTMTAGSDSDFKLVVDVNQNINFPITLQILVEETKQTFSLPN
jgi:hypothetical protein